MPRTKGAKNKNVNTAKNKNIININVNSSKSKRGRPRKTTANTNTQNRPPTSGGGMSMAPPQVIITQPPADNSNNNSLLSSFITSKMLNETMNLNRSNITNVEPSRIEQPSYFNARESIIPKLPETPLKQELQPPPAVKGPPPPAVKGPPPPPPPPITGMKKEVSNGLNLTGLSGRDAMIAELKYAQSEEGKAEKARKKEAKKIENEVKPQQSTAEFLNMSFTPPKKDIIQMLTPNKEPISTAITPYKENKSLLDFVMGGSSSKTKTEQEIKHEKKVNRLKEIKKDISKPKQLFEYNDLKTELTGQPNPNNEIGSSMINRAIKAKIARNELENKKQTKKTETAVKKIQAIYKGTKTRQHLNNNIDFQDKIDKRIKQYSNAASEYHTRGKHDKDINEELRDILKMNRTGLKNYKITLGSKPKKPGPKGPRLRNQIEF